MKHVHEFVSYVIGLCVNEIQKEDNKKRIRQHIIHPLISLIYQEFYPYLMFFLIIITSILIFSLTSVVVLISRR